MAQKSIPGNVLDLLASADKRNGLPAGMMASIMQQEIGGNYDRFLADPTAYHYPLNAQGQRVAPTGKVSTAFGPFGIVESTAAQPGYGVAPLKDKSLEEQIRFASDYLAARTKSAGGLRGGLANYGQGPSYADAVLGRIGAPVVASSNGMPGPASAPEVAATPAPASSSEAPVAVAAAAAPPASPTPDAWQTFLDQVKTAAAARQSVKPADLAYGQQQQVAQAPAEPPLPNFQDALSALGRYQQPGVAAFKGFHRWG